MSHSSPGISGRPSGAALALTTLLAFAMPAAGATAAEDQIYEIVDASGRVVGYTDQPPRDGERGRAYKPEGGSSYEPALPARSQRSVEDWLEEREGGPEQDAEEAYRSLRIASPGNDEGLRDNAGNVTVIGEVEPPLREGHRMQVYLDGTLRQTVEGTSATLVNVDRGTHGLMLRVTDKTGDVLISSEPSVFHLQRRSVLLQP